MHALHTMTALAAPLLLLTACGGGDSNSSPAPTPTPAAATPTPSSAQPPAPPGANFDVLSCLSQTVVPGRTLADIVVPDSIQIDFNQPSGFPNGRRLEDPVIDVTLAALFLDLRREPVTRFFALPLNPPANDLPFRPVFPYLAAAQGNPPLGSVATSGFNFRTDPPSAYVRVDRMGMPAVATAVISGTMKVRYNDADPRDDSNLRFLDDISYTLKGLTDALSDDLAGGGFQMCATRKTS
ncbi:DUF4331 family protein [Rhizorhabdus dicambivorans]|uniref:DUF4331 domain-containing protein n=1 Tax=Rhizorhabdus dicambivorans TaxID=1850238 RepID=A0A2A4FUU6_9SPHN|nr:DUF4331 family protein [Rhizorhabdus dicambivorans]ATE63493.1 DUF4331 domain-containing protein [Rhizorhabdus dicambivorans]PCE41452.1 DUF4331 domain-containing protein [Rhizorhabdus dicambivorans]